MRRLLGASSGPLAVDLEPGKIRERLESAGWLTVAEGANVEDARSACWPALPALRRINLGYGSPRPSVVVVGDRARSAEQLPFASRSGVWLFAALRLLGYDELTVYCANARSPAGRSRRARLTDLHSTFKGVSDPVWIACGVEARKALEKAGVPHLKVDSPAHDRRWKYAEGPEGYAKKLTEAGLDRGPWAPGSLPLFRCEELPDLPHPYDLTSCAYKKEVSSVGSFAGSAKISDKLREEARQLFVIGTCKTLGSVADRLDVDSNVIQRLAREGDWYGERDEYHRQITEKAKEANASNEVRRMVRSRNVAWKVTLQELEKVDEAQQEPDYVGTPAAARQLSQIALALSEAGSGEVSDGREQLQKRDLAELAHRALERLKNGIGGGLEE